jgi:5-methylcytosine-specific restriction endonuclease McrA
MSSEYIPVALKQLVFNRANGLCEYCRSQARFAIDPLVIDHIQPVSRGGKTIAENLALSCQTCNNYKYTKTIAISVNVQTFPSALHWRAWASWSS